MNPSSSPARILVTEDNPQMAEILELGLQEEGVQVQTTARLREAIDWIEQQKFDLVLLDLGLPGADGVELLRTIKSRRASAHLPVIVVTGRHGTEDKLRAFDLGATDYVTKPFELVELRARVRSALRAKRLQDELSQANEQLQAKTEFLAKTSHEIRTQLGAVTAMTGLLLQTELNSQQRGYAETIFASGDSLLALLNDILNVSKIESGKLELEKQPFHLRLCLDEALDMLAAQCAAKKLDLLCDFETGTPEQVVGDITRLRQVLINLISNAVKFTATGEIAVQVRARPLGRDSAREPGSGGGESAPSREAENQNRLTPAAPVWDSTTAPDPHEPTRWEFHFSVRDTGPGIPPDRLGRLFRSFSQADSSITRQYGGSGLGLFISKGLVELMGGKLWAESTPGFGATFHFTVPLPVLPPAEPAAWQRPQSHLVGRRVLVVDDNAASGRFLARLLQNWGLVVRTTESGWQALEWLRIDPKFDLLMIDVCMPKLDGVSLARQVRQIPGLQKVPIAFLTLLGSPASAPDLSFAGLDQMLSKPIKPALLHSALLRVFGGELRPETTKSIRVPQLDSTLAARRPLRILLVDDNQINQKVAGKMLNQLGYTPDIQANGADAIAAVRRTRYDVVLMDVQMPGMDGLEATHRIREFERSTARAPAFIVAMTANAMVGDREKCLGAGMDDYIAKPFKPETLQKMLENSPRDRKAAAPVSVPVPLAPASAPSASPATVPTAPKIDMGRLLEFADGSADGLAEIIDLYLKQTADQIRLMRSSLAGEDRAEAARLAHTCAGASAICGIDGLVPMIRELEQRCLHGGDHFASLLDRIDFEFQAVRRFLLERKQQGVEPETAPLWRLPQNTGPVLVSR